MTNANPHTSQAEPSTKGSHIRRVAAFSIDYVLFGLLAFALIVLLTIFVDDLATARLALSAGGASLSAAHTDIHYGPAYYVAGALTMAMALTYVAKTLGGERQATFGMQLMALRLQRLDGEPISPRYAIAHTLLFVVLSTVFTPLILLAPLLLAHKQTLHDLLLDTVMVQTG